MLKVYPRPTPTATSIPVDVSTWEAKGMSWIRTYDAENGLIAELAQDAFDWAERFCQQPILRREHECFLAKFEDGMFPVLQMGTITSISYKQKDKDTWDTLSTSAYRQELNRLYFYEAATGIGQVESIRIVAPMGWTLAEMPNSFRVPIRSLMDRFYENRDGGKDIDYAGIEFLLQPFKMYHV